MSMYALNKFHVLLSIVGITVGIWFVLWGLFFGHRVPMIAVSIGSYFIIEYVLILSSLWRKRKEATT